MASRALLIQSVKRVLNSNQFKYLSSSVKKDDGNAESGLQIIDVQLKSVTDTLKSKDQIKYEQDLKGYITIESEANAVGVVSGVPEEHIKTRTVCIYMPAKNAMQSGTNNIHHWQISFDTRERWENPLMGWCSSGDPLQALRVNFATKEAAIEHCKSMGWNYFVQEPNKNDPKPRSYGTNFSWDKRTRVSTK